MRIFLLLVSAFLLLPTTELIAQGDAGPRYSHDGSKIFFYSYRHQHQSFREARNAELYMMDSNGSYEVRLSYTDHGDYSMAPFPSPDGSHLVFASGPDMRSLNVFIMDLDSQNRRSLGRGFAHGWSNDGSKFALGDHYVDIETGETHAFQDAGGVDINGTPSHDFRKMAVVRNHDDARDLWIVDMATGVEVRLTEGMRVGGPSWSFNDSKLVFTSYSAEGSASEMYMVAASGGTVEPLTDDSAFVFHPSFSPDGLRVVFSSTRDDSEWPHIYEMRLDEGSIHRLTGAN